jgi:pimeloyl-ACP methyl ester carboxylesterase
LCVCIFGLFCLATLRGSAQQPYPYTTHFISLPIEGKRVRMAYMDVNPATGDSKTVILFHGKNFNGYYWKDVAAWLRAKGYRVIIPDQVGWGKSDHPDIHYSFSSLAANSKALLDSLHISSVIVISHSMGGMLATRFTLMYPDLVSKLILEDPIGLEDYKTFVPYSSIDAQYQTELKATYDSYKKYMQSYFPEWKPAYDELVRQQAKALSAPDFKSIAWANALTYDMIYEQPVCYQFKNIRVPTLLIVGSADRTIVGKEKLNDSVKVKHGQYPELGEQVHQAIKGSELKIIPGVGHIPHIQDPEAFEEYVSSFLR